MHVAHGREWVEDIPVPIPVVHILLNSLYTVYAKVGGNVVDELFESRSTIGSPDMKGPLVRGNLPKSQAFSSRATLSFSVTLSSRYWN
jgi:hypothetical protein